MKESQKVYVLARNRCDPYDSLVQIRNEFCSDTSVTRVEWKFDHSINGDPFLRIVDEQNACDLEYTTFRHNAWIKTEYEAQPVALPLKSIYK
jgi:hypothetical protein